MKVEKYARLQNIWRVVPILLVLTLITFQPLVAQTQTGEIPDGDVPLRINTDLVTFNISVSDREGRAVAGLNKKIFNIFDNKMLQEIHFFSVDISLIFFSLSYSGISPSACNC